MVSPHQLHAADSGHLPGLRPAFNVSETRKRIIGFIAIWSILSNVLSTLLILIYRPFRIGDAIKIPSDALEGKVVDLNLMFITLEHGENELIQIPNNQFFQKAITRIKTSQRDVSLYDQLVKLTKN